ncbi:kinase-like domain-containing protein, partial [Mycena olivaceomarginata]
WVAKRFFDIGAGEGHVEIHDNREQLIQEAIRLSRTSYFLKKFIEEAKRKCVDIEQTSEVSMEQYEAACEAQDDSNHDPGIVIWLLEPRRSSRVKHWSGTNEYPPWHQNKLGSTFNAFAHYMYLFSQESTVLADLKLKVSVNENGQGIEVLFDMMTHTINRSSGVGDHGKTGIKTFLEKHECVNRCAHLRLSCEGFACNSETVPDESDDD